MTLYGASPMLSERLVQQFPANESCNPLVVDISVGNVQHKVIDAMPSLLWERHMDAIVATLTKHPLRRCRSPHSPRHRALCAVLVWSVTIAEND